MDHKTSRLALTAASTLLAVPMQTQAVAMFDASARFTVTVTDNTEFGNEVTFVQSVGPTVSPPPTLIGDAQLDPPTNSTEAVSGYIYADIAVGGSAGGNGMSGLAYQYLSAYGSMTVTCPEVEGNIPCVFSVDTDYLATTSNSFTPPHENAWAQAYVNFFGLEALALSCGSVEGGDYFACSLPEGEDVSLSAFALAEGFAQSEYPTTVSEPAALALLGIGTLGLAALRRRRPHGE